MVTFTFSVRNSLVLR